MRITPRDPNNVKTSLTAAKYSHSLTFMPSLNDVAELSGYSIATVSRVINGSDKVTASTRESVEKAMKSLGYLPSRVARRLRQKGGLRHLLGVILPNIQNPFNAEIARGIEDIAYANRFAVILCNSDDKYEKEKFYLDVMRAESVDGVILPPNQESAAAVLEVIETGMPVVLVDRAIRGVQVDTVEVDNVIGAKAATDHLIQLGHTRIAMIAGPDSISNSRQRKRGFEKAFKNANLPIDPELVRTGDYTQDTGRKLAADLLDLPSRPTAIFASNNFMALGALAAIHKRNLRIPEDVALIGFDDLPWAETLDPPLSVIRQPAYEVGQTAAQLLLDRLSNPELPISKLRLSPELILRKSC